MRKIVVLITFFAFITTNLLAQTTSLVILNKESISTEQYSKEVFDKIYPAFQNSDIIGMGEATHGTEDFNVVRIELIKYLIEYHELKTIVFEAQFNISQIVNDYLIENIGSPESALIPILNGFWHTQNMRVFLQWINEYNQDKMPEDKVRYFGCDIYSPHNALFYIEKYLNSTGKNESPLDMSLDWFIKKTPTHVYSKEERKRMKEISEELDRIFEDALPKSNLELKLILQYKRLYEQYLEVLDTKGGYKRSVKRDMFMAENVEFIFNYTNQKKMIVWAHNTHLARKSGHEKIKPLGSHLSSMFGSNYYSLATAFNKGGFYAYDYESKQRKEIILDEALEESYDSFFAKCQYSQFFLHLQNNKIPELNKRSSSRNIGAGHNDEKNRNYRRHVLTESYDGILFFNETKAVNYIPIEKN